MTKHNGPFCGGRLRSREGTCTQPRGWGTDHPGIGACKLHGGNMPNHVTHARRVQAEAECAAFGIPIITTADAALRDELAAANGAVKFLRARCAALTAEEMTLGVAETRTRTVAGDGDGQRTETVFRSGMSVWMRLLQWWSAHRAEVAESMVRLEIDQRHADMQAMFGERLADALDRALNGAEVPIETRAVVLRLLAGELSGDARLPAAQGRVLGR